MIKLFSILLAGLLVISVLWMLFRSGTNESTPDKTKRAFLGIPIADNITIRELPDQLKKLANGQTEFEFIGIHSNGIDCIYLMYENDTFNIDFEAMWQDQLPYIDRLKQYAETKQIKTTMTTYGNSPHYQSQSSAPVLQLKANANLESAVELARDIQAKVFDNTDETVYEVVP